MQKLSKFRNVYSPVARPIPQSEADDLLETGNIVSSDMDDNPWLVSRIQIYVIFGIFALVMAGALYTIYAQGATLLLFTAPTRTAKVRPAGILPIQQAASTPEPTRTPRPTATSEPTVDAIYAARLNLVITENAATTVSIVATQVQEQAEAVGTNSARQTQQTERETQSALNISAAQTVVFEQATAHAGRRNAEATATAIYLTAEMQNLETRNLIINVGMGAIIALVLVVLLLFAGVGVMKFSTATQERQAAVMAATIPEFDFAPVLSRGGAEAPVFVGGLSMNVFNNIATLEQLYELARGIEQGVALTHDNWTPSGVLLSEGKFARLQNVLVKFGRAKWSDPNNRFAGIELTDDGRNFFNGILTREITSSPLPPQAPETPPTPSIAPIDDGFTSL